MTIHLNRSARGIVSVRADATQLPAALAELNTAFAAFKDEHTKELADIKKGLGDVVQSEKVERINADIGNLTSVVDDIKASITALQVGGSGENVSPDVAAHAEAFGKWFRKGEEPSAGLRDLEVKAKLNTGSDPDGGYLIPQEMDATIARVLGTVSVMRQIARVQPVSTDEYKMLVNMGGAGSGWVGEESARAETSTPTLRELKIVSGEIYANPAITQRSLDDSAIDIAAWLSAEVATTFAEQEGAAFISGNGVNKPRGLLSYDTVANASYVWGKLGFVVTGAAADFASSNPADAIISLYYGLKAGYRNGASFLTSDAVVGSIRKFKDGQGNYLWSPPTADMPGAILGKPVYTDDNMPALAANAFPLAFGDFSRGYMITDRFGTRVLRDPYTNKPNVMFYTTKRVGGGVTNFEAIKLLKCST